ncbi:hypothetical protein SNE40_018201 [Patella caerulea]|uniref:Uncharacterized protein n=1 Tax=Patella caerulea TaxID=87958 RepID=A0AAN8JBC8_PATCE
MKTITYKKWKDVNVDQLKSDLVSKLPRCEGLTVCETLHVYNKCVETVVNDNAPERTCTITVHDNEDWYSDEIRHAKRKCCHLEKQMKRTGLTIDRQIHSAQRNYVNEIVEIAKREHFGNILNNLQGQKEVFNVANKLLFRKKCKALPSTPSGSALCTVFSDYFMDKILQIRLTLTPQAYIVK